VKASRPGFEVEKMLKSMCFTRWVGSTMVVLLGWGTPIKKLYFLFAVLMD